MTDFKENLELIQRNINLNYPDNEKFKAEELSWGEEESMGNLQKKYEPQILIGSELAYDHDNILLLLKTIDYYRK